MAVAVDLPETVLTKTREGKLSWERLSAGAYFVTVANINISLDASRTGVVALRITNEEGLVVETFSSSDRTDTTLEDLYEIARRQALRVDETLLDIKRNLDSL